MLQLVFQPGRSGRRVIQEQVDEGHADLGPQAGLRAGLCQGVGRLVRMVLDGLQVRRPDVAIRRFHPALVGAVQVSPGDFPQPGDDAVLVKRAQSLAVRVRLSFHIDPAYAHPPKPFRFRKILQIEQPPQRAQAQAPQAKRGQPEEIPAGNRNCFSSFHLF